MFKNRGYQSFVIFIIVLALTSLSCGISDLPFIATETPTPTATFTPSPTLTPSPTPTQTPSPTPMPTGILTKEQSDGSTLFVDYDNEYQLILPTDWFVIPLSSEDITDILNNLSEENPEFQDSAEAFKQLDPDVIRVIALNRDTKYIANGFSTNLTVTAIKDSFMSSMPVDFVTGALEESLKSQGATLISDHVLATKNINGVEIGTIELQQTAPTATGANIQVRSKILVFLTDKALIMVQLATPQQFTQELLPVLDQITDSIELIEP